jgi:hypothetical protein
MAQRGSWRLGSPDESCGSIVVWTFNTSETVTATVGSFLLPSNAFVFIPQGGQGVQVFYGDVLGVSADAQMDAASQYCAQLPNPACTFEQDALPNKSKVIYTTGH